MYDPIVRSAERATRSCRPRRLAWLLALAAGTAALPGLAQAASCAGVAQWDQAKIYRAGDTLQKGGVLYRANQDIWLSLIHISEPTRREWLSRMPSSA